MTCEKCGAELVVGSWPFCPHGKGMYNAIGDEMDHWQVNGTQTPIHFTSKQERQRWLKANGYREYVRHIGTDSDQSKHTTRWVGMDPQTLENARVLLERAAKEPARNEPDPLPPIPITTYTGTVGDATWVKFHER